MPVATDVMPSEVESIRALPEISRVGEIAFETAGAGAHAEAGRRRGVSPAPFRSIRWSKSIEATAAFAICESVAGVSGFQLGNAHAAPRR